MYGGNWLPIEKLIPTVAISSMTFLLINIIPLFTKLIPSSLLAIITTTIVSTMLKLDVKTLRDITSSTSTASSSILSLLPTLTKVDVSLLHNWNTYSIILPTVGSIMIICILETLLASRIVSNNVNKQQNNNNNNNIIVRDDNPNKACIGIIYI